MMPHDKSLNRRRLLCSLAAVALMAAAPAFAGVETDVVRQLKSQGYRSITVTNTLLGRTRILAHKNGGTREIILNPRTGEILRDLWTAADGSQNSPSIVKADPVTKGGGTSGDDGSDDDTSDDNGSDDNGSDDNGSDDNGSDDNGSDDNGSDDNGSDDNGSDDNGSDDNDDSGSGNDSGDDGNDDNED